MNKPLRIILKVIAANIIIGITALTVTIVAASFKACEKDNKEHRNEDDETAWHTRESVRKSIEEDSTGRLKTGAVTLNKGTVIILGTNGYSWTDDVPKGLLDKIKEINKNRKVIDDVCITEEGLYAVVYDYGKKWFGTLPQKLKDELNSLPSDTKVLSLGMNDKDEYIIVTRRDGKNSILTSSPVYSAFARHKEKTLGSPQSATLSDEGAVFCFSKGAEYCGTVPEDVAQVIQNADFTPAFVKFDRNGGYIIVNSKKKKAITSLGNFSTKCATVTNDFSPTDAPEEGSVGDNADTPAADRENGGRQEDTNSNENRKSSGKTSASTPIPVHTPTQHPIKCGPCGGTGRCSNCSGSGISYFGHKHICGSCGGQGRCTICGGSGISGYTYY